jgi:hypothetical protein
MAFSFHRDSLLRTRGERPRRRRAAEQRDELAPSHVQQIPEVLRGHLAPAGVPAPRSL